MQLDFDDYISITLMLLQMGSIVYALILTPRLSGIDKKAWPWFILMLLGMFTTRSIVMLRCVGLASYVNTGYALMLLTSLFLINYLRLKGKK